MGAAGIMVSKIDQCMLDLMRFHGEGDDAESEEAGTPTGAVPTPSATVTTASQSPKSTDSGRVAAGNRLMSYRPQSPMSDSANSADADMSQSPSLSQTPPPSSSPPFSHAPPQSQAHGSDDRYL